MLLQNLLSRAILIVGNSDNLAIYSSVELANKRCCETSRSATLVNSIVGIANLFSIALRRYLVCAYNVISCRYCRVCIQL